MGAQESLNLGTTYSGMEPVERPTACGLHHLLTRKEVAEICGISLRSVAKLLKRDEIPYINFGRSVRVRVEDLEMYFSINARCRTSK